MLIKYNEAGLFHENPTLLLLDRPSASFIDANLGAQNPYLNYFIAFVVSPCSDIKLNEQFNYIIQSPNILDYIEVVCLIKFISIQKTIQSEILPQGYTAICGLEFEGTVPDLLFKLPVFGMKQKSNRPLMLTQKVVLEKLISDAPFDVI